MGTGGLTKADLGASGLAITRVGFGAWAIGGGGWHFTWGAQDDRDSVATIRASLEAGINWIDTAAVYGNGHSEQVVARALRGVPDADRPFVFTKGGLVWDPERPTARPRKLGDPANLRRELEASLARLEVERVDLYQMHWPPDDGTPLAAYWETLLDLRREGKVRAIGLSNHDVAQLEEAETLGHVDTVQPPFSLLERAAAEELLPWCVAHDTGVIVYSPMASGLLTGTFSAERVAALDPDDWRASDPAFTGERLSSTLRLVEVMRGVAARHDVEVPAVAVAWTLGFPGVTGAIVGARHPDQIAGWLPAADLRLEADDLEHLAAAIGTTGVGTGPPLPAR